MKHLHSLLLVLFACSVLSVRTLAANPFLFAANDKPVSVKFHGTEWNDEYGQKEFPLSAKVVTTRVAQSSWGAIFKITFEDISSKLDPKRELRPVYYIATDDEIVLLNEQDNEAAAKKLAAQEKPPTFEPGDGQGVSKGTRKSSDKLTETSIFAKGNRSTYQWSHNSGHFTTIVWQKGLGLIEYAQGYGAHKDGYHLKRVSNPGKGDR
jgi:hypothetical protein